MQEGQEFRNGQEPELKNIAILFVPAIAKFGHLESDMKRSITHSRMNIGRVNHYAEIFVSRS